MPKRTIILVLVASLALVAPVGAGASDATLVRTLVRWSQRIGADSKKQQAVSSRRSSSLAQVKAATRRVLGDAVGASRALAREGASTTKGTTVKSLSVKAFRLFAQGERQLLASLDAAAKGDTAGAATHGGKAMTILRKAAGILRRAGNLADEL